MFDSLFHLEPMGRLANRMIARSGGGPGHYPCKPDAEC